MSVRPLSVCISTDPTGRIFPKFDTEGLYEKSDENKVDMVKSVLYRALNMNA